MGKRGMPCSLRWSQGDDDFHGGSADQFGLLIDPGAGRLLARGVEAEKPWVSGIRPALPHPIHRFGVMGDDHIRIVAAEPAYKGALRQIRGQERRNGLLSPN